MSLTRFSLSGRIASFRYAFQGIATLVIRDPNARIHAIATAGVTALGFWKGLTRMEWAAIVLCIGVVWLAEALNTAVEVLCDLVVGKEFHPLVKIIKDVAAGGVLLVCLAAVVVGCIIFLT